MYFFELLFQIAESWISHIVYAYLTYDLWTCCTGTWLIGGSGTAETVSAVDWLFTIWYKGYCTRTFTGCTDCRMQHRSCAISISAEI